MTKRIQVFIPDGLFELMEADAQARGMLRGDKPNLSALAALKLQMIYEKELAELAAKPKPKGRTK